MEKLTFFILTLFLSQMGICQTWAPTGAKWTYGIGFPFAPGESYREWIATGDTLVGGKTCRLIKRMGFYVAGDLYDQLVTYEDSNRIYWHNPFLDEFIVLYDFNKDVGETWTVKINDTCEFLVTVVSTGMDTLNGFPLKTLDLSSDGWVLEGKVIQNIGNLASPFPNVDIYCFNLAVDWDYYLGLRCYEDSVFGSHHFNIAPSCTYINVGLEDLQEEIPLTIFPNPTRDVLTIKLDNDHFPFDYKVLNLHGQVVKKGVSWSSAQVDLTGLKAGVYFVMVNVDDIVYAEKIMKISR